MVVTQKEFNNLKVELNQVLEGIDKRLKALEEAEQPKTTRKAKSSEGVDKAA